MLHTVIYIQNRTPNKKCAHSPHEQAIGRRLSIDHLKVLGCAAFANEPSTNSKLAPRAEKLVTIGYDHNRGYRLFHPQKGAVFRRRDVIFDEDDLPLKKPVPSALPSFATPEENLSYRDAMSGPNSLHWKATIANELQAMAGHQVWDLVPRSEVCGRIMSNRWVFRRKNDGSYKARLVIRGFTKDVSNQEVFADVLHSITMRALFANAAKKGLHVRHADISTAFLHAPISPDQILYVSQTQGMSQVPGMVCKLQRALYGLRTAPHRWQHVLRPILDKHGFRQLRADGNVFRRDDILLSVYVDNLAIFGPDDVFLRQVIDTLGKDLRINDLGPL